MNIVVHRVDKEIVESDMDYIHDKLNNLFPDKFHIDYKTHMIYVGAGRRLAVIFRWGDDPCKFGGVWPEYYLSDSEDIANVLEQGACKIDGKRLYDIDLVIRAIAYKYLCEQLIDYLLGVGGDVR